MFRLTYVLKLIIVVPDAGYQVKSGLRVKWMDRNASPVTPATATCMKWNTKRNENYNRKSHGYSALTTIGIRNLVATGIPRLVAG